MLVKTPFGALSADFGYGGIYFYERPSEIRNGLQFCTVINVTYALYLSRNVFLSTQVQNIVPSRNVIQDRAVGFQQVSVGVGYYIPDLEVLFRQKF
jgi:hypothetical protein